MSRTALFVLLGALLPCVFSLGFVNSNIPQIPYATTATGAPAGYAVGKVDPRLKFAQSYVQDFQPIGTNVLLSLSQANNFQEWSRNRAVVVRVGPGVTDTQLVEGSTVILNPASGCNAFYGSAAEYLADYPGSTRANAFVGTLRNGVSVNNGWPLTLNVAPETNILNAVGGTRAIDADANQQYNYVVCPVSSIFGIVQAGTWNGNRGDAGSSYVQKPAYAAGAQFPK